MYMDVPVDQARKVSGRVLLRIYIGFWTVSTVFHVFIFFQQFIIYKFREKKWSAIHLYLRLFVGGSMFYLRYLCLFGSSLPPPVCRRIHVLFTLFVCLCIVVSNTYCVVFLFCLSSFLLCTLCCQSLWIVHFWLPLRHSLMFIYNHDSEILQTTNQVYLSFKILCQL